MLVANENSQLVMANKARVGSEYTCPTCHQPVRLRHGKKMVAHFAHLPGADCVMNEGETAEHLLGKQQLFDRLVLHNLAPRLEVYLPQINQRPDILFNNGGVQTAIEFQCSPLSVQRLRKRNGGYRQLEIIPVWVLGKPYRRRLSRAKIAQFTQVFGGQPAILYWNTQQARFEYQQGYYYCSFSKKRLTAERIIRRQSLALSRPNVRQAAISHLVFSSNVALSCCPLVCHDTVPSWPVTNSELIYWRIAVVLYLGRQPLFAMWKASTWQHLLTQLGQPFWLDFTCLDNGLNQSAISCLTTDLQRAGVIKKYSDHLVLCRHPKWFNSLEAKLAAITDYYSAMA